MPLRPNADSLGILIRSYSLALAAVFGLLFPIVSSGAAVSIHRPLTKIRLIHALTVAEARSAVPIEVEGVVTAESGFQDRFFLEDRTGGVYVERGDAVIVKTGDYIRVRGVSTPGQFAPNLRSREIQVLQHGSQLPIAKRINCQELSSGGEDCLRVELQGVIHSATILREWGRPTLGLSLEMGGGIVSVRASRLDDRHIQSLVDSTVTVRGVAGAIFNRERLKEVIERTMALIRPKTQAKQIGLSCETAAGTPVLLRGDPTRLRQVLVNLLSNASKFTEQGTISLAVRPDEADRQAAL